MEKVLITGITGLLGTNLSLILLEKGYSVIGIARAPKKYKAPLSPHLKLIKKELCDDFSSELKGVDYVVHIAANTAQNNIKYATYFNTNTLATKHLYEQACRHQVKKFIFISSANTLGFGSEFHTGNENCEWKYPFKSSFYAQSKKEAEDWLLKNIQKTAVIILNPTFMLGAYDTKPSSGKIIQMILGKKIIFYPPGGKNFVYVNDVAYGIINSFYHGKNGEKYLLCNENLSYKTFYKKVCNSATQSSFFIKVPKFVLFLLGYLGDFLRYLHIRTVLSKPNLHALTIYNYFSNGKSIKELNMRYTPLDIAIKATINYFERHKTV
ncbi:MAG: NAD-dependent epimerase/dehydratase family protein [Bacteroidota bacterium]